MVNGGLEGSSYQAGLLLEAFKSFQIEQPWDFEQIHNSDHGLCKWGAYKISPESVQKDKSSSKFTRG
ncbi:hypothetical protein PPACK8108_LOCUS15521 [Phakopsora pachyrhizi]|nr:hypothetical protein PPACK8108_LOCUS15521 [Phakopsora pachyrhizi]